MTPDDAALKEATLARCRAMSATELWAFASASLRISAWAQQVLIEKGGPDLWQQFNKAVESGRIEV